MERKNLRLKTKLLLALACIFTIGAKAQVIDTTHVIEPALTDKHLVYAEVIYHNLDEGGFNGAFTLSPVEVTAFGDYSAAVAFYEDGLQVRIGSTGFNKTNTVIPVAGQIMKLWFALDVPNKTYQAYAQTGDMEEPVIIYEGTPGFRNTDVETNGINRWSTFHYANEDSLSVEAFEIQTSSDATLKSLTSNVGEFEPAFEPTTLEYDLIVPFGTTSIDLDPVANGMGASIAMYDGDGAELSADGVIPFTGDGIDVDMYVTALDGTEANYYIAIFVDEGTSDATLASIDLSVSALDPVFDPEVNSYTVVIPQGTTSVDITGNPNFPEATVTGDGTVAISGGTGSATINVTSQDGSATKSYTINFVESDGTNYALQLPGDDGNLSNVDISGINITSLPFTIEMWIKPEGDQPNNAGLLFNRPSNIGLQYASGWQGTNLLRFMTTAGEGEQYGNDSKSGTVTPDKWHHVAVTVTNSTRTVYLDGVPSTEVAQFSTIDFSTGSTYIGWDSRTSSIAFKGAIDDIKIWSDSISSELLASTEYQLSALNGDEANLIAYYNFDLNNASQAIDLSATAHNGIITGGTYVASFSRVNLDLATLGVSAGKMYPAEFQKGINEYLVVLPAGTGSF